jgi:hypothetical protein
MLMPLLLSGLKRALHVHNDQLLVFLTRARVASDLFQAYACATVVAHAHSATSPCGPAGLSLDG